MSKEASELIFPFTVLSEGRKEPLSKDMEKAALFCFAELERNKGGGLIIKQPPEKTGYLAEFGYPLWLAPWGELTLVFDGLALSVHEVVFMPVPDMTAFNENLERSSRTLETYTDFLSDNINYFQPLSNKKRDAFSGLITEPGLLGGINSYLIETSLLTDSQPQIVKMKPTIDESAIQTSTQGLDALKSMFREDITRLYATMKLLSKTSGDFTKAIRSKMKAVREEFGEQIAKQEAIVKPKVERIHEEYDDRIRQLAKNSEKQILPLHKEKAKLEKLQEQANSKIERCKIEVKTAKMRKDNVAERKWKEKLDENNKEFSHLRKRSEETEARIKEAEQQKSLEAFRLRSETEAKIKEARKGVLDLEASRDAKTQIDKQDMDKLASLTTTIVGLIDKTAKQRETDLSGLEKLGIKLKRKTNALAYVPFYLARYQSEKGRRYLLFPPSIANNVGLKVKLKGALGKAKIREILTPRFQNMTTQLNKLPTLLEQNPLLARETNEAGAKADILKGKHDIEALKDGLSQLKAEGWFSEKEYAAFKRILE